MDKVLDKRTFKGELQYLIQWSGYTSDWDSWESEAAIEDGRKQLLKAYEAEKRLQKRKPTKKRKRTAWYQ